MACHMSGKRQHEQATETTDEETVYLFAAFYLFFEFRKDSDLALVLGFENGHNKFF